MPLDPNDPSTLAKLRALVQTAGNTITQAGANAGSAIDAATGNAKPLGLPNTPGGMAVPQTLPQRNYGNILPSQTPGAGFNGSANNSAAPLSEGSEKSDANFQKILESRKNPSQIPSSKLSPDMKQRFDTVESALDFGNEPDPADKALMKDRDPERFKRLFNK
jgi:hypothetical protein